MFKILSQTVRFYKSKQTPNPTSTTSDEVRMRKSIFWAKSQESQDQPSICLPPGTLEGVMIGQPSEYSESKEAILEEISIETAVDPPTPTSVRFFAK
ncbi:hypothetical protein DFH28DRAFT_528113 [Melampsora americana]|nr:hypothetical protein DFH28DRAFT_528113 [Melampsora americana]